MVGGERLERLKQHRHIFVGSILGMIGDAGPVTRPWAASDDRYRRYGREHALPYQPYAGTPPLCVRALCGYVSALHPSSVVLRSAFRLCDPACFIHD